MEQRSLTLPPLEVAADELGFFRWGRVGGRVLVTNDAGDWTFLGEAELADLLAGRVVDGHARFAELQAKGLVRDGMDLDALAARVTQRNRHVRRGAYVHVVTLTRRVPGAANGTGAVGLDMSAETAAQVAEFALRTMSPALTIELQGEGGEPLLNFDVLRHFVEVAQQHNKRTTGKRLTVRVLTNFAAMTEERAEWLIANDVHVVTSLDGPAAVHDALRAWKPGSAHADVVRWIGYFTRRYAELGRDANDWHVAALLTVTRQSLDDWRAIVDEYVARGLTSIRWQPLLRSRVATGAWPAIGYTAEAYLDVYRRVLDYILDLNRRGVALREVTASIFLAKILTAADAGAVDIQSPYGGGTAQVAYDVDGRLFPDDDARRLAGDGDALFELGHVGTTTLTDLVAHPTVRAIAAASLLEAQPMCAECWNKPYCGFSPVQNYLTQGDLFGQRPRCWQCKEHMAVSRRLFELLGDPQDPATRPVLERWAADASRPGAEGCASRPAP